MIPLIPCTRGRRAQTLDFGFWISGFGFGSRAALLLACIIFARPVHGSPDHSPWESSIVTVEVTHSVYEFLQPWSMRSEQHLKTGVVVGPRQVLTTAEHLDSGTLVRLQKGGRGQWWDGEVEWIDYHANLALLTTPETNFWRGLRVAPLADPVLTRGSVEVMRWRDGGLETRKGDVNRVTVARGKLTFMDYLDLEVTAEIKGAGWAEAVVAGRKLAGLVVAQRENVASVLPSSFIRSILEARRRGQYRGLGWFAFVWQRAQNPALHDFLRQTGQPQGVVIVETPPLGGNQGVLQPRDVVLQVDGFDIDIEGDYLDPAYGKLLLENLATRRHWAGDEVPLRIWRNGAAREVKYRLPKAEYSNDLVPQEVFDHPPEYLVLGGLLFQPLTEPYLRSWGPDWRRRVPFRLAYYEQQKPTPERPSIVILSMVLPDPYNIGYQDYRFLAVSRINGKRVVTLRDAQQALEQPQAGFDVIDFERGDSLQRIVLDARTAPEATRRVMDRYGITKPSVLVESGK